jgi:hypothetical protein
MIDLIRTGFFKTDETVLFWHTGGQRCSRSSMLMNLDKNRSYGSPKKVEQNS